MNIYDKLELVPGKPSRNRIVMPPMDTLMAEDGHANSFHVQHYASRAYGGAGTIIVESAAVSSEGKIRPKDLGLWKDSQIESFKETVFETKRAGAVIGVQLNHAGSKAEVQEERYGATKYYTYMDKDHGKLNLVKDADIKRIGKQFVEAAKRAKAAGFDFVELHSAHGYLMHQTLSNSSINDFNGDLPMAERGAWIINVAKDIKEQVGIPVGIRLSVTDADPRGNEPKDYKEFIKAIEKYLIYVHASSGVLYEKDKLDYSHGPLVGLPSAKEVKSFTKLPVISVRNYQTKAQVEEALAAGIDAVSIGREQIFKPSLVVTELIEPEDLDMSLYHWNDNLWYNHKEYSTFKKSLKK